MDINMFGVLNTIEPILPRMILRRTGTIALMSSLAGVLWYAKRSGI
jgi:NADP-dependent 3-hydroxy acid dehydrogenase YdfG